MPKKATPRAPAPMTGTKIKHLASEAMTRPSMLTTEQIRELGGSVMAHIEPRKNNKGKPASKK
jgi:hypothetical protein